MENDTDLVHVDPETGKLTLRFHEGQLKAWECEKRFVLVLAGTQGGKTSFGPPWMWREIQKRGPGDYLFVSPTFPLFQKKALPEFLKFFQYYLKLGEYVGQPQYQFNFTADGERRTFGRTFPDTPTRILFGHAQSPDSLESSTAKAAWLDEAGQNAFKSGSWDAILRRLSLNMGRVLLTTTPYNFGWLKRRLYDPWMRAGGDHPEIEVVRFESIMNPLFKEAEWERAQRDLPKWKFDMMYRALFTKPAGLIYESFDEEKHKIPRFEIPDHWYRYVGIDFGGVNTAAVFYAADPEDDRLLYLYRTYKSGGQTAKQHAERILLLAGGPILKCYGGSKGEGQWRSEFIAAGLPVLEPLASDVEVGINRVYGAHARNEIMVFDDLRDYLDEKNTYSREIEEDGEVMEKIADKNTFHFMDAERYIIGGWLRRSRPDIVVPKAQFAFSGRKIRKPIEDLTLPPEFRN